jgi:hypothetical protein
LQGWYIGNFAAPIALLAGSASAYFAPRQKLLVCSITLFMSLAGFFFSFRASMPWQEAMYRAGVYLHHHPEVEPVASFNAGIIGYFSDDRVTNVDGLVNDSIHAYAKKGTLAQCFAKRHIKFLLDFPVMFVYPIEMRGGYGDGKLEHCIQSSIYLFPDDLNQFYGDQIRLYRFDSQCLASAY